MHNEGSFFQMHAGGGQCFRRLFQHFGQQQKSLETCQWLFQYQGQRQSAKLAKVGVFFYGLMSF